MPVDINTLQKMFEKSLIDQDQYQRFLGKMPRLEDTAPEPVVQPVPEPLESPFDKPTSVPFFHPEMPLGIMDDRHTLPRVQDLRVPPVIGAASPPYPLPAGALAADLSPVTESPPTAPLGAQMAALAGDYARPYGIMHAAANQAAAAAAAKGREEAAAYEAARKADEARIKAMETQAAETQKYLDDNMSMLQKSAGELANLKIDPKRFWADKSTGDRVLAGIGLFLGAFNPNGGNRAVEAINRAIERDIDIQKADIEQKNRSYAARRGVLADMVGIFRDKRAAVEATRVAYLQNAQLQLSQIAAKYSGSEAAAKAGLLHGEIEERRQKAMMNFLETMKSLMPVSSSPTDASQLTPEQRKLFVPGYGLALTEKGAEKMNTSLINSNSAIRALDRLIEIADMNLPQVSPELSAEATTLASLLQGKLRPEIVGPGAASDQDMKLLRSIIANPTDVHWFGLAKKRLQTVKDKILSNLDDEADQLMMSTSRKRLNATPVK